MIDWDKVITAAQRALDAELSQQQALITAAEQQRAQGLLKALEVVARKVIVIDDLNDAEVDAVAALYPSWFPGMNLSINDLLSFDGMLWKVIQSHVSQSDWTPPQVPALFVRARVPVDNVPLDWVAAESVVIGDERLHLGILYRVIQSHTTQVGWEPPNVPALWAVV